MIALPSPSQKRKLRRTAALAAALGAMLLIGAQPAASETAPPNVATRSVGDTPVLTAATAEPTTEIQRFCSNIADAARDRRYALQATELETLQADIDKRMKALEEKRAEYEEWLKRRNEFMAEAEDGVVKIYARMRPDAAAERLAEVDAELAAAILMKLDSRQAGVILNEMERKAAAALTGIMASAARKEDPT
jgi:flagellar motility protein MotE (MotC chaperone)